MNDSSQRALHCQETIIADRPGIGSGSFGMGGGTLQLEGGAEFAHSDADQYNLGQLLVRFGLPWFELGAHFRSRCLSDIVSLTLTPGLVEDSLWL